MADILVEARRSGPVAERTTRQSEFFQEVGTRAVPGVYAASASREAIQRFLKVSERYGYWNATPEENARVGLSVP